MFVAINVDRLSSVADLFPIALRRFGIADRFECCECKRCDDGSTVNSLLSLDALGILSGTSLLFCVSPSDLPAAIDITPVSGRERR